MIMTLNILYLLKLLICKLNNFTLKKSRNNYTKIAVFGLISLINCVLLFICLIIVCSHRKKILAGKIQIRREIYLYSKALIVAFLKITFGCILYNTFYDSN